MTTSNKKILIYLAVFLPISIITVALRAIALLINLDGGGIYFESKAMMTVAASITLAFVIFALSYAFDRKNRPNPAVSFVNPQTYIPSGLAAAALLFVAKDLFAEFLKKREADFLLIKSFSWKTAKLNSFCYPKGTLATK